MFETSFALSTGLSNQYGLSKRVQCKQFFHETEYNMRTPAEWLVPYLHYIYNVAVLRYIQPVSTRYKPRQ